MEQREQSQALLELCRVATEGGYFQMKEIKESAFGTGCAQQTKRKISVISEISVRLLKNN
jgi:hypothetical protein